MNPHQLKNILEKIGNTHIGVIGDYCIDAYWMLNTESRELSIETGKPTHAVMRQTYNLGGAGNVVKNLVDIGVGKVYAFAVTGDDIFGREMLTLLKGNGVNTEGVVTQNDHWQTSVYAKPFLGEDEQERIDFGRYNALSAETEDRIISILEKHITDLDALIVNQQLPKGVYSEKVVAALNSLAKKYLSKIFVVNSRHKSDLFENFILRLNAIEAARLCGDEKNLTETVKESELKKYAQQIHRECLKPIFISRGANGVFAFDGKVHNVIPGIQILKPVDTVGAGDTGVAAMTAALCAGATIEEAAQISNFAAAVTVQKLRQTGTATPEEIIEIGTDADYVYNPELSEDPRAIQYLNNTEIMLVNANSSPPKSRFTHAIFDHDGTISTLRQGWEEIMEPVMVRAILGKKYDSADSELYQRAVQRVRQYIDRSTGIETIIQMQALAEMVKDFAVVPESEILDAAGYKKIYNDELIVKVQGRIDKLKRGELEVSDLTVKGAISFLQKLYDMGIKLYMASGTDTNDVIHEAEMLGYAQLFEGRIYGYSGNAKKMSKKMVMDNIIEEFKLPGEQLICFGDGPVELREVKKKGGMPVGIASDEVRRFGFNSAKLERLIKAGADIIIPDFSQQEQLLKFIFPVVKQTLDNKLAMANGK